MFQVQDKSVKQPSSFDMFQVQDKSVKQPSSFDMFQVLDKSVKQSSSFDVLQVWDKSNNQVFTMCFRYETTQSNNQDPAKEGIQNKFDRTIRFVEEYLRNVVNQSWTVTSASSQLKLTYEVKLTFNFIKKFWLCFFILFIVTN